LGDLFSGIKAGAMNLLNVTTYFQMKSRAGMVGEQGVNRALREIRAAAPSVRIHLIGHSFGARVVTAAAAGAANEPPLGVETMSLLQGAFSHYAFAEDWDGKKTNGFFRRVVAPPGGATYIKNGVIITHSRADKAVGMAYAIASRAGGQVASGLGDAGDKFGGLGGNGAQKTPEHVDVPINRKGERYTFAAGKVHNIDGNGVIADHSDIRRSEVTHAVADVVRTAK
jgi:pimeloyl-ACP methyl ester carboxylesterase